MSTGSKTFNVADPPRRVTDPRDLRATEPPKKTLYRYVDEETPTSLIVGWRGVDPIFNEIQVRPKVSPVPDGWSDTGPVLEAPREDPPADLVGVTATAAPRRGRPPKVSA